MIIRVEIGDTGFLNTHSIDSSDFSRKFMHQSNLKAKFDVFLLLFVQIMAR